ncbi:MAG: hypothetical protein ACRYGP_08395 [Janthinobacterium lividum]
MPLRIPERERPARVTIGNAFAHLVRQTIKPESGMDLAAAVHFASMRVFQRGTLTEAQAASALAPLDFLDTDPIDIATTILDGVVSGRLSVKDLPDSLTETWLARPFISNWVTGAVFVGAGNSSHRFYPTLDRAEVDALFAIGSKDVTPPEQTKPAGPVSPATLTAAVREIMASDRLTEAQAKERATQHIAPRTFSEAQWRAVWRNAPNKRRRGEKPTGVSGA